MKKGSIEKVKTRISAMGVFPFVFGYWVDSCLFVAVIEKVEGGVNKDTRVEYILSSC